MKHLLLTLCLVISSEILFAQQENPVSVESKIDEVTVYLDGAQIRSVQTTRLTKGQNILTIKGLPSSLEDRSIQLTMPSGVDIVSVSTSTQTLPLQTVAPQTRRWNDTLSTLKQRLDLLTNQVHAYETEKKLLAENQNLGGRDAGVPVAEIMKAADFYRERTLKIDNALTSLQNQIRSLTVRLDSANAHVETIRKNTNLSRKEIALVVNSTSDQRVDFQLKYQVTDASWEPTYDLLAADITKPVSLRYNALIYNDTDIDWKNVKLILSTGDPTEEASRPYLTTWNLNYTSQAYEGMVQNQGFQNRVDNNIAGFVRDSVQKNTQEIAVSELATTFPINQLHSIAADSQPHQISVSTHSLEASYEYLTIPKVDMSAFLIARVTGWEKLSLIDGTANVYFGNTYIGESRINTRLIGDTLELSLGRDNQVVVKRSKVEDFSTIKSVGGKKVESLVYEISVRNNKAASIQIRIQDQLPVSQESDIVVDADDISGAALDVPSGRLQWRKQLAPGETIKHRVAFSVKYPKNKTISLRKSRVTRTPRFRND